MNIHSVLEDPQQMMWLWTTTDNLILTSVFESYSESGGLLLSMCFLFALENTSLSPLLAKLSSCCYASTELPEQKFSIKQDFVPRVPLAIYRDIFDGES
jgi:hypothetical protein